MAGKPIQHGNPPKISYMDAMRLELETGRLACQLQADEFADWIDRIVPGKTWEGYDWLFFADRWAAILALVEQGVDITHHPTPLSA